MQSIQLSVALIPCPVVLGECCCGCCAGTAADACGDVVDGVATALLERELTYIIANAWSRANAEGRWSFGERGKTLRSKEDVRLLMQRVRHRTSDKAPQVASAVYSLKGSARSVALTFDDGPDERFTPEVLDILAQHDVKATFFIVGRRAEKYPEVVRRIVSDGHAFGSHSFSHPDLWDLSLPAAIAEFRRGRSTLEKLTASSVKLFRPPKGMMKVEQALYLRAMQFKTFLWSQDPEDWASGATPEGLLNRLAGISPGDIVLLHDGIESPADAGSADRSATVAALPRLIDMVRERDCAFVALA